MNLFETVNQIKHLQEVYLPVLLKTYVNADWHFEENKYYRCFQDGITVIFYPHVLIFAIISADYYEYNISECDFKKSLQNSEKSEKFQMTPAEIKKILQSIDVDENLDEKQAISKFVSLNGSELFARIGKGNIEDIQNIINKEIILFNIFKRLETFTNWKWESLGTTFFRFKCILNKNIKIEYHHLHCWSEFINFNKSHSALFRVSEEFEQGTRYYYFNDFEGLLDKVKEITTFINFR